MERQSDKSGRDQPTRLEMMISTNIEIQAEDDDPLSLEKAAMRSRMPHNRLTNAEQKVFPDIKDNAISRKIYLAIRNTILQLWLRSPREQLTLEASLEATNGLYNSESQLTQRIYAYLDRYGYINFGVYKFHGFLPTTKHRIIVIGAGISGLIAARQLESFGFEVVIFEARDRVGGRMALFHKPPYLADLGAMVIAGLGGNPVITLAHQVDLELQTVKPRCPLFNSTGETIQRSSDEVVEKEFNRLLEACAYLGHTVDVEKKLNRRISLGECLSYVMTMQQRQKSEKQMSHFKTLCDIQEKLSSMYHKLKRNRDDIERLAGEFQTEKDKPKPVDPTAKALLEYSIRVKQYELNEAIRTYDALNDIVKELEKMIIEVDKEYSSVKEVYLTSADKRLIDWHIANLEFANAAPLNCLSLKHWDQDDVHELGGNHLSVKNGYAALPIALAEGLTIKHQVAVQEIKITSTDASILFRDLTSTSSEPEFQRLSADAVLCTLPLGVLKAGVLPKTISENVEDDSNKNSIVFDPPLPKRKIEAIEHVGFGKMNKVVLCFDRIFWDPTNHTFGFVNNDSKSRGEFFTFWTLYREPVIIALIAGEAAEFLEKMPDAFIIERCLSVLRTIYPNDVVKPKESVVTRWGLDEWSRGSYSYVGIEATGVDYDVLAAPMAASESEPKNLRLFFAGEHTCRQYPATVHGALVSGLREAGRIADTFLEA